MRNVRIWHLFALFAAAVLTVVGQEARLEPDLILHNGKIFTPGPNAGPNDSKDDAIAIKGERILAVGVGSDLKKTAGHSTRMIDLEGKTVLPGFNDSHSHFMPDPDGVRLEFKSMDPSWAETVNAIRGVVAKLPKGKWIFGEVGFNVLSDNASERFTLDSLSPRNPILLRAFYGHGYLANSEALRFLRIGEYEPDMLAGRFDRVAGSERVNGKFWAYAEFRPNRILASQVSDAEIIARLKAFSDQAVGFGVTSVTLMSSLPIERFTRLLRKADLLIRVRAIPFPLILGRKRDLSEIARLSKLILPNSKVQASGIKWVLDGTPWEHGSLLRQPYYDRPESKGILLFSRGDVEAMLRESLRFGEQILFHCSGDKCAELVLEAMEKIDDVDWKSKRVRIEHGDGLAGDLVPRAKKLGIIVVQNPTHFSSVEMIFARFSPKTTFFPVRSLIDQHVPFALGSDGPMNPYLNIMLASIHPARPDEAITRRQAVEAYTYGSSFAEFAENDKGTLSEGKLADLVVLSQDVFTVPISELRKTRSVLTIIGGRIVFKDAGF